ncbi:Nicotinamide-nucleotide amidohydrolase PncC [bioreactor metagenome]|uniref:Nicotinamide-nucleotide amidohydrolase PncC n=1 Tax=bioreactor metagenome TaxID=1076179 RepID=A0A645F479_9ZZZZ
MNILFEKIDFLIKELNAKTEKKIARILFNNSMTISVAESCTGGLISSRLTDIAGSSSYIKNNFVTYSNDAKINLLGVNPQTLEEHGAVSEECALEMAEGLYNKLNKDKSSSCDITLSITGIAGPGGATADKNVGLVYVAVKNKYSKKVKKFQINPKHCRKTMKLIFSQKALDFLFEFLQET